MGSTGGGSPEERGLLGAVLAALEAAGIGLVVEEPDGPGGRRCWVNEAAARLEGHAPAESAGALAALALPARADATDSDATGVAHFEAAVPRAGADPVPVSVTAVARGARGEGGEGGEGAARTRVALLRDRREEQRGGDALGALETRFRGFADAASEPITVLTRGRIVYANPAALGVLGVGSLAELAARPLLDWVEEADRATVAERLARILAGEQLGPYEYRVRRADGIRVRLELVSLAVEHDGAPAVLSVGRDVSERERLQTELRRAEQLAALGTLAAGVAHEINNPLAYVLLHLERLASELAQDTTPASATAAHALGEVRDGCERIRLVVSDLLAFSRPTSDTVEPVDVDEALDAALKLAAHALRHRARVERARADGTLVPRVQAARGRLVQALVNLLINAAEAFADDSTERNEITIDVTLDAHAVVVRIADNGRGIRAEDAARVFDPFFTTKPTGTGLGLAITRSILEAFGGSVALHQRAGGGTSAEVRLRPWQERPSAPAASVAARAPQGTRAAILVVDDEPALANLIGQLLEPAHDVEVCVRSREALERIRARDYDVILCDLMMPELTGIDLWRSACETRPRCRDRFVFVTGGVFTASAAAFLAREQPQVLRKPFTLEELEEAVQSSLERRRTGG
ncbi:MAG: response regulator [Myxococcales bacterium]|nr:response regulator [Myxococcales bacterium]